MSDVGSTLTEKAGPLPMWAWIVGGGVGLGLVVRYRRGATATTGVDGTVVAGPDSVLTPFAGASNGTVTTGTDDNDSWRRRAVQALVDAGVSPVAAEIAISHFLNGEPLSPTDQGLVEQAVRLVGIPPTAPPSPSIAQAPIANELPPNDGLAPPELFAPTIVKALVSQTVTGPGANQAAAAAAAGGHAVIVDSHGNPIPLGVVTGAPPAEIPIIYPPGTNVTLTPEQRAAQEAQRRIDKPGSY